MAINVGLPKVVGSAGQEKITPLRDGWELHRHALGFQVKCPTGWQVTARSSTILLQNNARQATIVIRPLLVTQQISAVQSMHHALAELTSVFPRGQLQQVKQLRQEPDEAVGVVGYRLGDGAGKGEMLCLLTGRSGMLYAIAAPGKAFPADKHTMIAILKSFSFTQPAASAESCKIASGHTNDPPAIDFSPLENKE